MPPVGICGLGRLGLGQVRSHQGERRRGGQQVSAINHEWKSPQPNRSNPGAVLRTVRAFQALSRHVAQAKYFEIASRNREEIGLGVSLPPWLTVAKAGETLGQRWRGTNLVSWFRSSQCHRYRAWSELRNQTTLGINKLLVSFDSEFRQQPDMGMPRISESGH